MPVVDGFRPRRGDAMIVASVRHAQLLLDGRQKYHVADRSVPSGSYWLACGGQVLGRVRVGEPVRIYSLAQWHRMMPEHMTMLERMPHKEVHALPVSCPERLDPVPCKAPSRRTTLLRFQPPTAQTSSTPTIRGTPLDEPVVQGTSAIGMAMRRAAVQQGASSLQAAFAAGRASTVNSNTACEDIATPAPDLARPAPATTPTPTSCVMRRPATLPGVFARQLRRRLGD